MSKKRHEPDVRSYAATHPAGRFTLPSGPGWSHLVHPVAGTITVITPARSWTVPPGLAVWVADGERVRIGNRGRAAVRTLYLSTGIAGSDRPTRVLFLTPLIRALFLDTVATAPFDLDDEVNRARITLLLALVDREPSAPLALSRPTDPRAADAADLFAADPTIAIDVLAVRIGVSRRTLERLFRVETGLSLGAWCRRWRILLSLEGLSAGVGVTRVAADAGYSTPSAFVVAFRAELGLPPGEFLRRNRPA